MQALIRDIAIWKAYEKVLTSGDTMKTEQVREKMYDLFHGTTGSDDALPFKEALMKGQSAFDLVWTKEKDTGRQILSPDFYIHRRIIGDVNVTLDAISRSVQSKPALITGRTILVRAKKVRRPARPAWSAFVACAAHTATSPALADRGQLSQVRGCV